MASESAAAPFKAPPTADRLLDGLTAEQAQAVRHGPGVLLIVAGPGAGKTRVLVHRIAYLLAQGLAEPREILAVTFSVRAASELRLRLAELLGEQTAAQVTAATFHSVCARLLREHAPLVGRCANWTIFDAVELRAVVEWLLSDRRRTEIQQALADFGRPASSEVLHEISLAKNRLLTPESYERAARHPAGPLIAAVWRETDAELRRSNAMGFDDLLVCAVRVLSEHPHYLELYRRRWPWIVVDEYQDTCRAQGVLVELLGGPDGNVSCVGDEDQCVAEGTLITLPDRSRRKIEAIRPGDTVLSNHGAGRFGPARVTRVQRKRAQAGVAITLASGRRVVSTPEHTHFAGFVAEILHGRHLVYLMFKRGLGYRLGMAAASYKMKGRYRLGPAQRRLHERADAVWVLGVFDDEREARLMEAVLAARYGLPMMPFRAQHGYVSGLVSSQGHIDRLYAAVDTTGGAARLMNEFGLTRDAPHEIPQWGSRTGQFERRAVVLRLCSDTRNGSHAVHVEGSDREGYQRLRDAGYPVEFFIHRGRTRWRVDRTSGDYGSQLAFAQGLACALGAQLRRTARLTKPSAGSRRRGLPFCRATSVRQGMVMANDSGELDEVTHVERVKLDAYVYDLDIQGTHNYVAGGIVTHNCIYGFRGSDGNGLARLAERFPAHERIVLARNFRSHAEVLSAAAHTIRHNPDRVPKTLIAMRGPGGEVGAIAFSSEREEASWIASIVAQELEAGTPPSEILLLARTAYANAPVQTALAAAGIPHRVLGSLGLYERSEVRDALAYLTLIVNPADAQAFRRAVSAPRRGVGERTAGQVVTFARESHGGDLVAASATATSTAGIGSERAREQLERFGRGLRRARSELATGRSLGHVTITAMMLPGGLVQHYQRLIDECADAGRRRDAERVLDDLRSLCRAVQTYEERHDSPTLAGFLEHARGLHARELSPGEEDRRITISTIHRGKGTEAALVILAGCEERLLPSWRSLETPDQLHEERRLFYVACTRAKDRLYVTHAATRGGRPTGGPSRFLAEAGLIGPPAPAA